MNSQTQTIKQDAERIAQVQSELNNAVDELFHESSLGEYVEALTSGLYADLCEQAGALPDRNISEDTFYKVHEKDLRNLYTSLRLVTHLAHISDAHSTLQYLTKKASYEQATFIVESIN